MRTEPKYLSNVQISDLSQIMTMSLIWKNHIITITPKGEVIFPASFPYGRKPLNGSQGVTVSHRDSKSKFSIGRRQSLEGRACSMLLGEPSDDSTDHLFSQNLAGFIGVHQMFSRSFMSPSAKCHLFHHFIRSMSGKMLQTTSWNGPSQSQSYPIEVSTHLWTGCVWNKANIWKLSKIVVLQMKIDENIWEYLFLMSYQKMSSV